MSDTSEQSNGMEASKAQHTLVDRSIAAVFLQDDTTMRTPSDIAVVTERLHRLHGTSLIHSATLLLKLSASCYATACVLFHRFYHQASLKQHDVWSTSMACTLLATKVEEEPRPVRQIVLIFAHLYRRRRLVCHTDAASIVDEALVRASDRATALSLEQKETLLRHVQPLSPLGPAYEAWRKALFHMEQMLLRQLGFVLYWIPDQHPHKFILYFVRVLEIDKHSDDFAQNAWKYCNDSCRLDLCVRYEPELIACAAIHMAACDAGMVLPAHWWDVFVGSNQTDRLSIIFNALAGLQHEFCVKVATFAFVQSLSGNSFNDPDSYLWSVAD